MSEIDIDPIAVNLLCFVITNVIYIEIGRTVGSQRGPISIFNGICVYDYNKIMIIHCKY